MVDKLFRFLWVSVKDVITAIAMSLPNDLVSCVLRRWLYRLCGVKISQGAKIFRNVLLLGRVEVLSGASISNNSVVNGGEAGVLIGYDTMVAPGCCIVAFSHGMKRGVPMVKQELVQKRVVIESDVWLGANVTVTSGVKIGTGAVVGANSVVTRDVEAFEIVGGVPAKRLKTR